VGRFCAGIAENHTVARYTGNIPGQGAVSRVGTHRCHRSDEYSPGVPSLTPGERWRIGLAVLTAFVGPEARRAADITSVVGADDPREVLFGVLAVARDLLGIIETRSGISSSEILQALAQQEGEEWL
jgi:hypothetical protein